MLVGFCKIAKQEMAPDSQETIQNHSRNLSARLKRVLTVLVAIGMGELIQPKQKTDLALAAMKTKIKTCLSSQVNIVSF